MAVRISASSIRKKEFWGSAIRFSLGAIRHAQFGFRKQTEVKLYHRFALGSIYNEFLTLTGKRQDKQAYQLGQAFNGYVLSIDPHLDNPNFGPRTKKSIVLSDIKSLPISKKKASEFVLRLSKSRLSKDQKKQIIRAVNSFRKRATLGVSRTFKDPFADFKEVIQGVKMTGGDMYATWAEIVAIAQKIDSKKIPSLRSSFSTMSVSLQFVDDAFDCVRDFNSQQNLFVSLAKNNPLELEKLKNTHFSTKISFSFLKKNFPLTFDMYSKEFDKIVSQIPLEHSKLRQFAIDAFYGW